MANPWFRMYSEFATDPKIQMLSEANQRRFVMLLCMRGSSGKNTCTDEEVCFQLRISSEDWQETKKLFIDKNFIDENNSVLAWDKRQFMTGNANPDCVAKSSNYVYFVASSVVTVANFVVKVGISKNPWARLKDLQTGNANELKLLGSFRADIVSDSEIHKILGDYRTTGEWFKLPELLASKVLELCSKRSVSYEKLRSEIVAQLRSNTTVATKTTTDTDTDTDTDISNSENAQKEDLFAQFWKTYPRKTDRAKAKKKFETLKIKSDTLDLIEKNIRLRISTGEWDLAEKNFIPMPSTYLNGRRWEDESVTTQPKNNYSPEPIYREAIL